MHIQTQKAKLYLVLVWTITMNTFPRLCVSANTFSGERKTNHKLCSQRQQFNWRKYYFYREQSMKMRIENSSKGLCCPSYNYS